MKKITINTEYIKLGQLLKFAGIIENGAMAKDFLAENIVLVNGEQDNRRGRKIYPNDKVSVKNVEIFVEAE